LKLPVFQIDAFASKPFEGNPAAVCPLTQWLPDALMQAIAAENNLSETAFFVQTATGFHIRWFTPTTEVDLCGHATLATAYVLFHCLAYQGDTIRFASRSGPLTVARQGKLLVLDFPARPGLLCKTPAAIIAAFGIEPVACLRSDDYIVVLKDEHAVAAAAPQLALLRQLDRRGVIITAPAQQYDFVARFFAPKCGIDEDPVTGSAYTQLAPYWSAMLGRTALRARQLSARGGEVGCELAGDRVLISGTATQYMQGSIELHAS